MNFWHVFHINAQDPNHHKYITKHVLHMKYSIKTNTTTTRLRKSTMPHNFILRQRKHIKKNICKSKTYTSLTFLHIGSHNSNTTSKVNGLKTPQIFYWYWVICHTILENYAKVIRPLAVFLYSTSNLQLCLFKPT